MKIYIFFLLSIIASVFFIPFSSSADSYFSQGVFIKGGGPEVYFLEDGMKRWVETAEVFNTFGFDWNKIKYAKQEELDMYPTGYSIKSAARYPEGVLLRRVGGFKVYKIENGYRKWVQDVATFNNLGFSWDDVYEISEEKMKKIRERDPITQYERVQRPETVLLSVPEKNVLEDTTSVKFKFSAVAQLFSSSDVVFDTFLDGVDRRWVVIRRGERKVTLPKKGGDYIFYVRARYKDGEADLTPEMFKFRVDISPIYEDVVFSAVRVTSKDPEEEYITLINKTNLVYYLSGWSIESKDSGRKYNIPSSHLVPNYPGYNYEIDVRMEPKDKVTIYSSKSPMGYGFRLNNCSGYLNDYFNFTPALPKYCPKLDTDEIDHLTDYCQSVIKTATSKCSEPDYNDIRLDNECRDFMRTKLNYQSCAEDNVQFYDFYKGEWRLYLGRTDEAWTESHDTLLLRDQNGLVVDTYKY